MRCDFVLKYAKISFIDKSQHSPGGCGESDWNILLQGEKILRRERKRRFLWIYKTERRPAVTDTMRVY